MVIYLGSSQYFNRVSTNLTEQISRRFHDGFQEKSRTYLHCFVLLCNVPNLLHLVEHVMMSSNQKHDMHFIQHEAVAEIK